MTAQQEPAQPPSQLTGLRLFELYRDGAMDPTGLASLLDIRCPEVEDGRIVFTCKTRPDFANPLGQLHGGIAATLLDSAMGCAVHTTLPANQAYTSLDISVRYIRPGYIDGGELRAEGKVVHRGRKVRTAEATLTDESGKLIATATSSLMVLLLS
ncbi:PaaI family thioesterase [Actinospica sp. MGRD01-02]|uniref:PaaI family thioesterase n=1 Tax=Actinospica acidithermotolerans TaxID=2828514 RepID=A0A941EA92_9ACTN|nr:PaaI family thioesterase [Actinospica acidithermotolerans]MBR7826883.1 PaaI family thioesterase [Actinospica acidithermotolerans]